MAKFKTKFDMVDASGTKITGQADIIGKDPLYKPYVSISTTEKPAFIKDKDLERFAVNILKALKSKHLKP